jgi:hypothetical protein
MAFSITDTQHKNTPYRLYAKFRDVFIVMLNVIMLSFFMLNVVILSVVAP